MHVRPVARLSCLVSMAKQTYIFFTENVYLILPRVQHLMNYRSSAKTCNAQWAFELKVKVGMIPQQAKCKPHRGLVLPFCAVEPNINLASHSDSVDGESIRRRSNQISIAFGHDTIIQSPIQPQILPFNLSSKHLGISPLNIINLMNVHS